MPFQNGFDFSKWGFGEYLIISLVVLVIVGIVLFLVYKNGNKTTQNETVKTNEEVKKTETNDLKVKEETKEVSKITHEESDEDDLEESDEDEEDTEEEKGKPKKAPKYHISQNKDDESTYAGMWRVRKEGSKKTIKFFKTQKEAIDFAENLAANQDTSIVIHKKNGAIRKQDYTKKK